MDKTKAVIIIGDGVADRPVPELDGRTPLEAARTPNMDRLASEGECGQMDPIAPGIRAGSDTSHLALLGYDPFKVYTGRGPFEALGIGMDVQHGDICFRCNFSTVEGELRLTHDGNFAGANIIDRRAERISTGTHELAEAVSGMKIEDVTCYVKESVEHRAALILRGPDLGPNAADVDPHEGGIPPHASHAEDEHSRKTARILNQFTLKSWEILKDHPVNKQREQEGKRPANILLPRGGGIAPNLEPFHVRYGMKGAAVVETGLIAGIARYLQMTTPEVKGATGAVDTDELALGRAVIQMFDEGHEFVLCNLKTPDLDGHDGRPEGKVHAIEKMDNLVGYVLENHTRDVHIAVTGDHATPISIGDHSGDTVPIAIWGPNTRRDAVTRFDERSVVCGSLSRIRGSDIMNILTNLMGTQEKFGA